jgi:glycosyltransferase 2 family protein
MVEVSQGMATAPAARTLRGMSRRKLTIAVLLGLPVSAVFLWLALRKVDFADAWDALTGARPGLVLAAVGAVSCLYIFQAARWRVIAAQPQLSVVHFTELVLSGIAVNNVLPGRIGDLFRARWLGLDARIPGGRALATVVVDRGFDVLALVTFLVVSLPFVTEAAWLDRIVVGGLIGLACLGLLLVFARAYTRRRPRERREHRRLLRRIARDTVEGLALRLGAKRSAEAAGLSVAAWMAWGAGAWLVARSLGIELSLLEAAFVTAAINLGVAIPSSPGFVGTYQWLAIESLSLFDVAPADALAFAIIMQAVWYVPTTLVGGTLVVRRGVRSRRAASPKLADVTEGGQRRSGVAT